MRRCYPADPAKSCKQKKCCLRPAKDHNQNSNKAIYLLGEVGGLDTYPRSLLQSYRNSIVQYILWKANLNNIPIPTITIPSCTLMILMYYARLLLGLLSCRLCTLCCVRLFKRETIWDVLSLCLLTINCREDRAVSLSSINNCTSGCAMHAP